MEINTTTTSIIDIDIFTKYMRYINLILSCTGVIFNILLIIQMFLIGRKQCATYLLLLLMTICDFLYCLVYLSIMLTIDQYINIINHQIICPLSFFLTPFAFTGSTLFLFICQLHFITNYERKYNTILGQIGGRLSVIFVLAFIVIRSVLSTTSVELVIPDPKTPDQQYCTIDLNTPTIVASVQKVIHVFSEVSDILVYLGWIIILLIYFISLTPCIKTWCINQTKPNLSAIDKPLSFTSLLLVNNNHLIHNNHGEINLSTDIELADMLNPSHEVQIINNKKKHNDISLIILAISFISIIFYLPIMICKYSTMYTLYSKKTLLNDEPTYLLQIIQHTPHLFCLSIRFLPYYIFDKRIHLFLSQMIGIKCMTIERKTRKCKLKHQYILHCQCHRRQSILEFNNNNLDQHNHQQESTSF